MNRIVQSAIAKFAAEHSEYSTKDGAYDNCCKASGEFCSLLRKMGVKNAFVDELSVVNGVSHKAVFVGSLRKAIWIDWTARQFNPNAAFPEIGR
jgi:hypothetical protein